MDLFGSYATDLNSPYSNALAVAPSDDPLPVIPRAININAGYHVTAGVPVLVRVTMMNGETVTLSLMTGLIYELRPTHIHRDGTHKALWPLSLGGYQAEDGKPFTILW